MDEVDAASIEFIRNAKYKNTTRSATTTRSNETYLSVVQTLKYICDVLRCLQNFPLAWRIIH